MDKYLSIEDLGFPLSSIKSIAVVGRSIAIITNCNHCSLIARYWSANRPISTSYIKLSHFCYPPDGLVIPKEYYGKLQIKKLTYPEIGEVYVVTIPQLTKLLNNY